MASSIAGQFVFIERSHFYIDSVGAVLCTDVRCKERGEFDALRSKMPPGHQNMPPPPPKP